MTDLSKPLVNVSRRAQPGGCSMCGEWRARNQQRDPAVIVIAGYPLCARHLALVHAIRDDAATRALPNRTPTPHPRRQRAL